MTPLDRSHWMQAYLDGTLAGTELEAFEGQLRKDADLRKQLYEASRDAALIAEIIQDGLLECLPAAHSTANTTSGNKPTNRHIGWILIAAVVLIVLGIVGVQLNHPVGTLTFAKDVIWGHKSLSLVVGSSVKRGTYHLQQGIIRYETAQGTVVTVGGPAHFELVGRTQVHLHAGTLSAQMGKAADPLTVSIGEMDVVDLGTAFGVRVHEDGSPTVAVFEGSVQVHAPDASPLTLKLGDAAKAACGQWIPAVFDPQPFAELWPLTRGVDQMSHLIEFIPPGPHRVLAEYRNNEKLFLMPEKMDVKVYGPLLLDLTPETTALPMKDRYACPLQDERISSFAVFFNGQEPKTWDQPRHIEGQITFSKRIIGVIYTDWNLRESERALGLYDIRYMEEEGRGLGPGYPYIETEDSITIGPDHRTIKFSLFTGPQMDQFRVIVAVDSY